MVFFSILIFLLDYTESKPSCNLKSCTWFKKVLRFMPVKGLKVFIRFAFEYLHSLPSYALRFSIVCFCRYAHGCMWCSQDLTSAFLSCFTFVYIPSLSFMKSWSFFTRFIFVLSRLLSLFPVIFVIIIIILLPVHFRLLFLSVIYSKAKYRYFKFVRSRRVLFCRKAFSVYVVHVWLFRRFFRNCGVFFIYMYINFKWSSI